MDCYPDIQVFLTLPHVCIDFYLSTAHYYPKCQPPTGLMSVQSRLLFETALSLVFEDGYRKDITLEALDAVDKAMAAGSIDAPLLKGIQLFGFREECLKYFQQALNGGSTHPLLYYYLGLYYQREAKDHSLALQYYEMALGGKCSRYFVV